MTLRDQDRWLEEQRRHGVKEDVACFLFAALISFIAVLGMSALLHMLVRAL